MDRPPCSLVTPDYDQDGETVQVMPIALDMDDGRQAVEAI